jgi:hypothetical protein
MSAAKRTPVHKRMGWQLDAHTALRVRIGAIWEKEPGITAREVLAKLRRKGDLNPKWVMRVMNECWRASARLSPKELRRGRRWFYTRLGDLVNSSPSTANDGDKGAIRRYKVRTYVRTACCSRA